MLTFFLYPFTAKKSYNLADVQYRIFKRVVVGKPCQFVHWQESNGSIDVHRQPVATACGVACRSVSLPPMRVAAQRRSIYAGCVTPYLRTVLLERLETELLATDGRFVHQSALGVDKHGHPPVVTSCGLFAGCRPGTGREAQQEHSTSGAHAHDLQVGGDGRRLLRDRHRVPGSGPRRRRRG